MFVKGYKQTDAHKAAIGVANKGKIPWTKGRKHSAETIAKMSAAAKGRIITKEAGLKIAESNKRRRIGGENGRRRGDLEQKLWREAVFVRDNWTCQRCKAGRNFNAHHIKNFKQHHELRTSIENGITFCVQCHKDFHKKYGVKNNTCEQISEFCNNHFE